MDLIGVTARYVQNYHGLVILNNKENVVELRLRLLY